MPGELTRTDQPTWLALTVPQSPEDIDALVDAAIQTGLTLDISTQPALWGGKLRNRECKIACSGDSGHTRATGREHAFNLTEANLIQILSCIGRECLDFYLLPNAEPANEGLIGAAAALRSALAEGNLGSVAILSDGMARFDLEISSENRVDLESGRTARVLAVSSSREVGRVIA